MKIILLQKTVNLGNLGDIVEVKNGYARNFLIPSGLAQRANEQNLKDFALKRTEYEKQQTDIMAQAQFRHSQIHGQVFAIPAKVGVDGKLFGSITALDIVTALKKSGQEIKKAEVSLPNGTLKIVGEFDIDIMLHHDLRATIKVNVVPENQE